MEYNPRKPNRTEETRSRVLSKEGQEPRYPKVDYEPRKFDEIHHDVGDE